MTKSRNKPLLWYRLAGVTKNLKGGYDYQFKKVRVFKELPRGAWVYKVLIDEDSDGSKEIMGVGVTRVFCGKGAKLKYAHPTKDEALAGAVHEAECDLEAKKTMMTKSRRRMETLVWAQRDYTGGLVNA